MLYPLLLDRLNSDVPLLFKNPGRKWIIINIDKYRQAESSTFVFYQLSDTLWHGTDLNLAYSQKLSMTYFF